MPIVDTARGQIHYKDYRHSDSADVPILLIHGAGSQYRDYHPKMRRELDCIALDLPGHGQSPESAPISIENYAADVVAFLEALVIERAIIIGHSMGGAIAQQIALDYPQVVHRLILIATGANLVVNQTIIEGIVANPRETAYLVTKWSWGAAADEKMVQQGVEQLLDTSTDVIQADYIACDNFDVRHRLHSITAPTLVIAGGQDKMTRLAWNQTLADDIPNSQITIFEGSGHLVHVEQVEAVIAAIQQWLRNI